MKTLKFMLAAATAIGLASATQADEFNTTGFEKLALGTSVTTGVEDNRSGYSYFYYAGTAAEDNESVITNGTPNIDRPRGVSTVDATRNNILQVSTGTDPLLRTYAPLSAGAPQAATELASDVYVDTLVQFTVTPYTDSVTNSAADKLMIYLKESVLTTNESGEATSTSTNLVVVGGYYNAEAEGDKFVKEEYVAASTVYPGQWYRLTVKVIKNLAGGVFAETQQYPAFKVYIDNELCTFDKPTVASGATTLLPFMQGSEFSSIQANQVVLSLLADGNTPASLQGVGFAGEGKVDDIVFSDLDPFATVFDFTFAAWDNDKVNAVSYTVGKTSYTQAGTYEVEEGTKVKIDSIDYKSGWQEGSFTVVGLADPDVDGWYTVTNTASFAIVPEEAPAAADWEADPTVIADDTPAATQYPALAGTALATVDAKKLTVWATENSVSFTDAGEATADSVIVEAFMLNCEPTAEDVEDAKDDFIATITVNADGSISVKPPEGYNVEPQLQGKAALSDAGWTDLAAPASAYKFYRFELRLPSAE